MTDELTHAVGKDQIHSGYLSHIGHALQERAKVAAGIARELKVDAVVEGSVTRSGSRVRIQAQLVKASSDHHLWADSYERDFRDVALFAGGRCTGDCQPNSHSLDVTNKDRTSRRKLVRLTPRPMNRI